jgi:hypothetical protein
MNSSVACFSFISSQILAKQNSEIAQFLDIFDKIKQLVGLYEQIHASYHFNFRKFHITINRLQFEYIPQRIIELKNSIEVCSS